MAREPVIPEKLKFYLAIFLLQFCNAGLNIVSKIALDIGVDKIVFLVYRNTIALLVLAPLAYFLEKDDRPPLTIILLLAIFLLALCGITANQGLYLLGLYYASPTIASAMQNSVPAITFVMAAALRLEQINIMRRDGLAKVLGTIACMGGATIITVYKGPVLFHNQENSPGGHPFPSFNKTGNWTLGCIYLIAQCLAWSAWIVLQGPVLRKYPALLSVTSITCFFGEIQLLIIATFAENDIDKWKISSGLELFTILYAGIFASCMVFCLQLWCIGKGGPLLSTVFQPVSTVLVAIMAALILGDKLYSAGVIGAIIIIVGLYSVLWGKSREKKMGIQGKKDTLTEKLIDEESS